MTRPPRDLTRSRVHNAQLAMTVRKEVKDMLKAEAERRGTTLVDLVEQSIRAYCTKDETNG